MKRALGLLLVLLATCVTIAGFADDLGKNVQASMVVTGSIVLNPDGSVNNYALDKPERLPPEVVELIGKTVPNWKFRPMLVLANNKPELLKAGMSLRIVALPSPDGKYSASVEGASFGKDGSQSSEDISWKEHNIPTGVYTESVQQNLSGIVYLILKVNHDGGVVDVGVEQVDLRAMASNAQMDAWRRGLSRLAVTTARNWAFNFPKTGSAATQSFVLVRIPLNFCPQGNPSEYGQWDAYVPGPTNAIPWVNPEERNAGKSADAIPNNGLVFQDDRRFMLLDPPGSG